MKTSFSISTIFTLLILLSSIRSYSQLQKTPTFRSDSITLLKLKDGTTQTGYLVQNRDSVIIFANEQGKPAIIKTNEVESRINVAKKSLAVYAEAETREHIHTSNIVSSPSQVQKRIISFEFFSPLANHLVFRYEQVMKNQMSLTGEIGIIGPGLYPDDRESKGFFLKAGPKVYFSPDWMMDGMYRFNDMQGGYFQPQIILTYFNSVENDYAYSSGTVQDKTNTFAYALMLNFGKQWVLAHAITLDIHFGVGYGGNSYSGSNDEYNSYQYSHVGGNSTTPFAMSAGLSVGIPLK